MQDLAALKNAHTVEFCEEFPWHPRYVAAINAGASTLTLAALMMPVALPVVLYVEPLTASCFVVTLAGACSIVVVLVYLSVLSNIRARCPITILRAGMLTVRTGAKSNCALLTHCQIRRGCSWEMNILGRGTLLPYRRAIVISFHCDDPTVRNPLTVAVGMNDESYKQWETLLLSHDNFSAIASE